MDNVGHTDVCSQSWAAQAFHVSDGGTPLVSAHLIQPLQLQVGNNRMLLGLVTPGTTACSMLLKTRSWSEPAPHPSAKQGKVYRRWAEGPNTR